MKVLYIESRLRNKINILESKEIKKLPKELILAYSIQYKYDAENIKTQLENHGIKIKSMQQVIGCSKINAKLPILLIGSGRFHASNLYLQSPQVFIFEGDKITEIDKKEIENIKNKKQSAFMKFLKADNVGILVTTKPSQENLKKAQKLKKDLIKKGKKAYIFISNNIDINQFENFQIDSWVNTACPGLAFDNPSIINYFEIPKSY